MAVFVLDLFFFPETFAPSILNKKARELRWKTGRWEVSIANVLDCSRFLTDRPTPITATLEIRNGAHQYQDFHAEKSGTSIENDSQGAHGTLHYAF
jgi:hypothetical protein